MRFRILVTALMLSAAFAVAQSPLNPASQPDLSRVLGVWRGQINGLPAFTLVVTDEGGGLSSAILFDLIKGENPNQPPTVTPSLPEAMLHPTFDGKTLTFQVSHRRAHPPRTLSDPPVTFTLTPTEAGKAQVRNLSEGPAVTALRSDH